MAGTISIEKKHFNISIGVAITILLFLITMAFNFATWKSNIEDNIGHTGDVQNHLSSKYGEMSDRIDVLEQANTEFKVQMATIQTQLANIESILLEIKQDIK